MEFNPTASPSFNAKATRWSTACIRPSLPYGYSVRTPKWHSLADAPDTIGLRFWNDLLAAFTRLQHAGIWDLTHFVLLNWLSRNGQIDWSHAVVESNTILTSLPRSQ